MESQDELESINFPDNGAMVEMALDYLNQATEILEELAKRKSFVKVQNCRD